VLTSEAILSLLFSRARRFACRRNTLIHHRLCRMRAARGGWIIRRNMRARSSRCDVLIPETVTARMPVCAWRRCFTKSCDRLQNHQPHSSRSPTPKIIPRACPSNQILCRTTPTCPTSSAEAVRLLHEGHPLGPVIYTPCQGRG
jgi:hypothetical protein